MNVIICFLYSWSREQNTCTNIYYHCLRWYIYPHYIFWLYYFFFALYKAVMFIHYIWIGPSQAIFVLVVLWKELGVSALSGFGVLLCLVPVQSLMGKLFAKLRWIQFKLICLTNCKFLIFLNFYHQNLVQPNKSSRNTKLGLL